MYSNAGMFNWCYGDSLVVSPAETTELEYSISGNKLTTFEPPDTNNQGYLDSNVVLQSYEVFSRIGSGTGIVGLWSIDSTGFTLLRGTLTDSERAQLDAQYSSPVSPGAIQIDLSGGLVTVYSTITPASSFIQSQWDWNYGGGADSALYDIAVTQVNGTTVRMTGNKTGEVVTLVFASNGDETFSSSIPTNTTAVYYSNPTRCPNSEPAWYESFLTSNEKVGAKALAKTKKGNQNTSHLKWLLRKLESASGYSLGRQK
jgi:hypothetical protein